MAQTGSLEEDVSLGSISEFPWVWSQKPWNTANHEGIWDLKPKFTDLKRIGLEPQERKVLRIRFLGGIWEFIVSSGSCWCSVSA